MRKNTARSFSIFPLLSLLLIFVLAALFTAALPLPAGAAGKKDLAATWHGFWSSPDGFLYEADLRLSVDEENNAVGSIHWTLRKSPRPQESAKIGLTGVEHVSGVFLPESGLARIEGISLDDPNQILGVDKYRLILSDDASVLGGITWNHGPWTGQILLHRQK